MASSTLKHDRSANDRGLPAACDHPESPGTAFHFASVRDGCAPCTIAFAAAAISDPDREILGDQGMTTLRAMLERKLSLADPFDPLTVLLTKALEALK